MEKKRVLILCTGNSARSQMAEGLLRHEAGDRFEVDSAGTKPGHGPAGSDRRDERAGHRHFRASLEIMSMNSPASEFDYVITVCDNARESCPVFFGAATRLHRSFDDPAALVGSEEERLGVFRRVRDELRAYLAGFVLRAG